MTFKKILAILITAAVLFACCAVGFSVSANQAETAKIRLKKWPRQSQRR